MILLQPKIGLILNTSRGTILHESSHLQQARFNSLSNTTVTITSDKCHIFQMYCLANRISRKIIGICYLLATSSNAQSAIFTRFVNHFTDSLVKIRHRLSDGRSVQPKKWRKVVTHLNMLFGQSGNYKTGNVYQSSNQIPRTANVKLGNTFK